MRLNDQRIRRGFHTKKLWKYHRDPSALVLDELGLKHGRHRADIAVVNGHLSGYEIKSDEDTLSRLESQAPAYDEVFDRITLIVAPKHLMMAETVVPNHWGIVSASIGSRGAIRFDAVRAAQFNKSVVPIVVAQLLWRDEAAQILFEMGDPPRVTRQKRSALYERLTCTLSLAELRRRVRTTLKNRTSWRRRSQSFVSDGSSQHVAKQ